MYNVVSVTHQMYNTFTNKHCTFIVSKAESEIM